jgi:uncharacterized protein (DUF924 family)
VNNLASPDDLLRVWFGEPGSSPFASSKKWFTKDEAFDRALREQFEETLDAAARGELDGWRASPREEVALVILLDQISRNIHRGTPRSFAQDELSRAVTLEMLAKGVDRTLGLAERYFVLMPLMHAEDVALQRRCVAEFEALLADTSEEARAMLTSAVDYAKKHAVIVERFGRFPHRNAILGRASTPEEIEFLGQPGSSF